VDLTTARRWKKGAICPPAGAIALLTGDLGFFDPLWSGWRLKGGDLVSPEGWQITRHDVLATPLMRSQIAIYQSENRALKARVEDLKVAAIEEQPTPDSWDVEILMA
jgi:hypothetical protein